MNFSLGYLATGRFRWVVYATIFSLVITIIFWGQGYVKDHMVERYLVYKNGEKLGAVSNPEVINIWLEQKQKELSTKNPQVILVADAGGLTYSYEKAFRAKIDNSSVIHRLENGLLLKATGVEIQIDGKPVGTVKDTDTAQGILDQIKSKYTPERKVLALSLNESQKAGKPMVETNDFLQKVSMVKVNTNPENITTPEKVASMLESGNAQPVTYTVQAGDCVSCIAKKFNISSDVIYQNNSWIENDFIKIGEQLDLTVLQPMLSVKTVETRTDALEIPLGVIYEKDDAMRAGTSEIVAEGKNGLKKVVYRVTKINGRLVEEVPIDETLVEAPIDKIVKQGTKVVKGNGTGSFAWPIYGAKLTSEFGKRWGKLHAGTDTVSSNRTIMSADHGKVIFAGEKSGYGNCIMIDHQNGYTTLYAHLSKIEVTDGQLIEKGEKIGVMGSTGDSTGVHLHFEIQKDGQQENPLKYLSK
ncbi:peptidoglycan DD-metalloendopeptidase family protein [Paenibacillus agricola]|uniref:Peptidoglycan DD-metalloendopeptidase family protein n=1 Tax=Paenibacillus agricola TaxID=2716264 RepID=A0ABX0IWE2_9BACL|nr:peptidoglycan DD-metalloendopeptidase family protein [Paenibacillus agricola]NHN28222.1 peptidoglycan DD-metalloendopeptidase family protein [Paenibacillus agricola]